MTFVETLLLFVLITWIFPSSWRATLIPVLAIPVSLWELYFLYILALPSHHLDVVCFGAGHWYRRR